MINKQGRKIVEDKTPAMGVMPVHTGKYAGQISKTHLGLSSLPVSVVRHQLLHAKTNKKIEIRKFPFTIGRMSSDDLKIQNKLVSRSHAVILQENNAIIIKNNSSLNGLCVNKHAVDQVVLMDGDEIVIANEKFIFITEEFTRPDHSIAVNAMGSPFEEIVVQGISPQVEYTDHASLDASIVRENTGTKKQRKKTKMLAFSVMVIALTSSGIYGYQYYLRQMQESRVFVVSGEENKQAPVANKNQEKTADRKTAANTINPENTEIVLPVKTAVLVPAIKIHKSKRSSDSKNVQIVNNKTSLREAVLFEDRNSNAIIKNAESLYHAGRYEDAISMLVSIENNKRHQSEYRVFANAQKAKMQELFSLYHNGNMAYEKGNKDEAFTHWEKLLKLQKMYFPGKASFYADKINDVVAKEYEVRGNQSYVKDDWGSAYQNWRNSLAIRPKASVEQSISTMDSEIKQLYRTGYRYETVNINRALDYWKELRNKAPKDHEYYIKASAKIKWYESARK